ncbi:MAG: MerR family transcriptional regulator [Solobacterium sp.]|nr:MerR family transcriptional regulator [Solobacterium sp.]
MKIRTVEELVGITRKNIRFYEEEGLLTVKRADNGYREYDAEDIVRLKQIKFLRRLFVPIEEIRRVLEGSETLEVCLHKQRHAYEQQKKNLDGLCAVTDSLIEQAEHGKTLEQLDIDACLEDLIRMEKKGMEFMDVNVTDIHRKKTLGSVIGALIMIVLMGLAEVLILFGNSQEPLPLPVLVVFLCIPAVIAGGVIAVLIQRIREIRKGEEDEAAKY